MGTRADFYTRSLKGVLTYRGSIAWDGGDELPTYVREAGTAGAFCHGLYSWFKHHRTDATIPSQGWPWPWEDSRMTDYSYVYDSRTGKVIKYSWGIPVKGGRSPRWPDMTDRQCVTTGIRSGLLFVREA